MIYNGSKQSLTLTDREVGMIDRCWSQAKDAADPTQLARIERSEASWRFWKASRNKGEFSLLNPDRFEEREKLFNDLQALGVTTLSEGGYEDYLDCVCIRYAPADEWNMYEAGERGAQTRLFFGRILEKLMPVLTGFGLFYRLFQRIFQR